MFYIFARAHERKAENKKADIAYTCRKSLLDRLLGLLPGLAVKHHHSTARYLLSPFNALPEDVRFATTKSSDVLWLVSYRKHFNANPVAQLDVTPAF